MSSTLIVDDDENFTAGLAEYLRLHGHDVETAHDLASARATLASSGPRVLLIDLMLPDGSGLELLAELGDRQPDTVALITGQTAIKSFVHSIAGPGVHYLTKPIESQAVLELIRVNDANDAARAQRHFGLLIGESEVMAGVYRQVRQVAGSDSTVFIQGDSGTGKELVAEALHRESQRSGPFVPVNCGGLTPELVASELFGHEKGSFTGAARRHAGYFERAHGGTLFLDEITEMPVEMQTQLLRVLETNRFIRVGGEAEVECDARLIAATNRDPLEAVEAGRLREDLYFRLQVFPIVLPPLRERGDDLDLLADAFLADLNKRNDTVKEFSPAFRSALRAHTWPGNVRELKHFVHRAYLLATDNAIEPPPDGLTAPAGAAQSPGVGQSIRDVERQLILSTLEHFGGDKKAAAATLGVSLKTLYNRLKDYDSDA